MDGFAERWVVVVPLGVPPRSARAAYTSGDTAQCRPVILVRMVNRAKSDTL
jgi:hypothetical protein